MPYKLALPEHRGKATPATSEAARHFYTDAQSSTYTTAANAEIQRDLTRHALELLQPRATEENGVLMLLDIGAGSGLSTAAAYKWLAEQGRDAFILAYDISASMLALTAEKDRADFYCGNAAQRFPLRSGLFDAAIGISMLQWLSPDGLAVCFNSLFAHLASKPCGRAVFQIYPQNVEHVATMEKTAEVAGFSRAEVFVSFPHPTTAKKWFMAVDCQPSEHMENHVCVFGRRFHRRCALQWLNDSRNSKYGITPGLAPVRDQIVKEHVKEAWHIWRKYRRALSLQDALSRGAAMHPKAKRSLEIWKSDELIGQALGIFFKDKCAADEVSYVLLVEYASSVVDIVHSVRVLYSTSIHRFPVGIFLKFRLVLQAYSAATADERAAQVFTT